MELRLSTYIFDVLHVVTYILELSCFSGYPHMIYALWCLRRRSKERRRFLLFRQHSDLRMIFGFIRIIHCKAACLAFETYIYAECTFAEYWRVCLWCKHKHHKIHILVNVKCSCLTTYVCSPHAHAVVCTTHRRLTGDLGVGYAWVRLHQHLA